MPTKTKTKIPVALLLPNLHLELQFRGTRVLFMEHHDDPEDDYLHGALTYSKLRTLLDASSLVDKRAQDKAALEQQIAELEEKLENLEDSFIIDEPLFGEYDVQTSAENENVADGSLAIGCKRFYPEDLALIKRKLKALGK